jgi:hypothetical protein
MQLAVWDFHGYVVLIAFNQIRYTATHSLLELELERGVKNYFSILSHTIVYAHIKS